LPAHQISNSFSHDLRKEKIIFMKLRSPQLALRRIAARVKQCRHDVPTANVLRRFERGWQNFVNVYRLQADTWTVYDNSSDSPVFIERKP
jgi:predicted ABC-type ATPase